MSAAPEAGIIAFESRLRTDQGMPIVRDRVYRAPALDVFGRCQRGHPLKETTLDALAGLFIQGGVIVVDIERLHLLMRGQSGEDLAFPLGTEVDAQA